MPAFISVGMLAHLALLKDWHVYFSEIAMIMEWNINVTIEVIFETCADASAYEEGYDLNI